MCAFHTALTGSSHTFMTWISPPHWAPSLRLHLLMNFHSVSLHVSLSLPHLSMTLWRCYRPHFPHSLNKQWAGLGRGGHGGVGWDRHWIITSSHSFQRKNDGKKRQNKTWRGTPKCWPCFPHALILTPNSYTLSLSLIAKWAFGWGLLMVIWTAVFIYLECWGNY